MRNNKYKLLSIGILLTLSGVAIYIFNKLISASAIFNNFLKTKDGTYYEWRFGNIFYEKQGSGPPLLLVHDLTASSSSAEWKSVVSILSQKYTVYTLDLLGCGRSDKPQMTYTNFLYVQLLTDFVKNVIGQKADVVASGVSDSFVVMACANNEEIFDKLMLINPSSLASLNRSPSKRSKIAKYLLELPLIGTLVYNIVNTKSNIELSFIEKYLYNPFGIDQSTIDVAYEAAHLGNNGGKYLLSSIIGNYLSCNIAHGLKAINNSIFIVDGEEKEHLEETQSFYKSLNPAIECEIIPLAKLLPQMETPEKVLEAIKNFF